MERADTAGWNMTGSRRTYHSRHKRQHVQHHRRIRSSIFRRNSKPRQHLCCKPSHVKLRTITRCTVHHEFTYQGWTDQDTCRTRQVPYRTRKRSSTLRSSTLQASHAESNHRYAELPLLSFARTYQASILTWPPSTVTSKEFNKYVKTNYEGLRARGERCDDIMINLFKGYMSASDSEFVRYIRAKKDRYEDGEDHDAGTAHDVRSQQVRNTRQETIVGMPSQPNKNKSLHSTAELKKLKDTTSNLPVPSLRAVNNSRRNGNQQQRGTVTIRTETGTIAATNNRSNNRGNRRTDKWAWKKIPPKDNESHTKTVNGKTYHWCDEHLAWTVHHPDPNREDGCSLKKQRLKGEGNRGDSDSRQGAFANALTSIITDLQDDAQQEWLLRAFRQCLLSSTAKILYIIASTLLADPVLLVPSIFSPLAIDMFLAALCTTAVTIFITRLLLRIDSKYKVSRRTQQAVMTLCMWIKSYIPTDNASYRQRRKKRTYQRRTQSRYCKRYYIRASARRPSRIANKTSKPIIRPILFANTSQQDIQGGLRRKTSRRIIWLWLVLHHVDSGASRCISNNKSHFESIEPLEPGDPGGVMGPSGEKSPVRGKGTIKWKIEDDDGVVHTIKFPGSLYVPDFTNCILCPQHWNQTANDHFPTRHGTWQALYSDTMVMYWDQRRYKRTIEWEPSHQHWKFQISTRCLQLQSLCSSLRSAARCWDTGTCLLSINKRGYSRYLGRWRQSRNEQSLRSTRQWQSACTQSSNDKTKQWRQVNSKTATWRNKGGESYRIYSQTTQSRIQCTWSTKHKNRTLAAEYPQAELLRWHYRLGHLSFARLRILALLGIIPRRLIHVKSPKCAGCIYGAMTKRPWRTKAQQNKQKIRSVTRPGDCVSVDQLESTTPGFIAQLKGKLTKQRYRAATVFVDHASRLSYVHLQKSLSSDETVQAKRAFEAYARSHGIIIRHYHADNGRFADNAFLDSIAKSGQTISFCGVNAHFQNGIAEKRIRDLQEQARKQLLHAKARWPSAIEINLWPYAIRNANDIRNTLPDKDDGSSPLERFCGANVSPKLRHNHTFGCPVYALDNRLQASGRIPKWNKRARLGINLGTSPRHASSVTLVLNMDTGLVSPQFHLQYDDFFETVRPSAGNEPTFSQWQYISGIKNRRQGQPDTTKRFQGSQRPSRTGTNDSSIRKHARRAKPTRRYSSLWFRSKRWYWWCYRHYQLTWEWQRSTTKWFGLTSQQCQSLRSHSQTYTANERKFRTTKSCLPIILRSNASRWLLTSRQMLNPMAFLSTANKDTMYFDQAMRAPDSNEFVKAVIKEVNDHIERKHWELIPREQVPKGVKVLPSVWSMKRKRDIKTQRVYKHKARLNVHGGKQEFGENYFETYAPVVTWFSIRLLLVLSIINNWYTRQVDFVLAYTQADIEFDMYMELPKELKQDMAMARLTFSSYSRIFMDKSKQAECGTST